MDQKKIGSFLKELRKEKGFTQETLAERADIGLMYFGEIERGVKMPSMNVFIKILEALASVLGMEVTLKIKEIDA